MVKEYKSYGQQHFNAYIENTIESERIKIEGLLRTTH